MANKILVSITVGTAAMTERYSKEYLDSATNDVIRVLSEKFGGASLVHLTGGYLRDDGTLETELSYRFEVVCDNTASNFLHLSGYARALTEKYMQECVLFNVQELKFSTLVGRQGE